jgi:hypothetical protein
MEESTLNHIMTPSGANSLVFVAMHRTVVDDHLVAMLTWARTPLSGSLSLSSAM